MAREIILSVEFRRARFSSQCPFCPLPVKYGQIIQRSEETGHWMHVPCAKAVDAGMTWRDYTAARKRDAQARKDRADLARQIAARAQERGMLCEPAPMTRDDLAS